MDNRRHYPNAPITEAIIDLKVDLPPGVALGQIEYVHKWIRADYPHKAGRQIAMGQFEVGEQVSASARTEPIGYLFSSTDKKQIVQAQLQGFSFSRLAPYQSWEPFREEARRVWKLYRDAVRPSAIRRLAVRNINRVDIPERRIDMKKYFRTSPEISPELPQEMAAFVMQLQLSLPEFQSAATISQTIIPPPNENTVSVVLDIDVFRNENLPQEEAGIWEFFEELRVAKNRVFEACITDAARDLFK